MLKIARNLHQNSLILICINENKNLIGGVRGEPGFPTIYKKKVKRKSNKSKKN
jgi:hypothetical protein